MLKVLLKFIFAFGIVFWLLKSGKLDFTLVNKSIQNGYMWLVCIGILLVQDVISAIRWKILLQAKSKAKLPNLQVVKLTWIGLFFNSFLPGAVTGDLIKLVYAKDLDPKLDKTFLVTTVVLDRVFGLIGLIFLMGLSTVINYRAIISKGPAMENFLNFNFVLFIGVIAFIVTLFLPSRITDKILNLVNHIPLLGKKIGKTLAQVWIIGKNKPVVLKSLFISFLLQFMNVLGFWSVTSPFYGTDLSLSEVFTFIPLGQIAVAIPISPAGLGVGHVIFDKLFSYVGVSDGASLFNLYFLCLVFVNLLGVFPYLLSSKKHSLSETDQFEKV